MSQSRLVEPTPSTSTTYRSELPRLAISVSTSRPASPLVMVSQPAVVSSQPPVHVLRVLSRPADTVSQAAQPTSAITIPGVLSSHPPRMSATALSLSSHFRPPSSIVTSFQAAFNRATFSSTTGPSLQQLLSPAATSAIRSSKSHLPFSSSSPNLVATTNKHVLLDSAGQVITTVLPPSGNGHQLSDVKLRKNLSVASGIASVSTVIYVILWSLFKMAKIKQSYACHFLVLL